jgi:hypothetical protein
VGDWSLLQLAALPLLAEASAADHLWVVDRLACMTDIPLMRDDTRIGLNSTLIFAFDSDKRKLAFPMLPMEAFQREVGVIWENFLTSYYHMVIGMLIPMYSVAYSQFLRSVLTKTSQALLSGILGPTRLSAYHFDIAQFIVDHELEMAFDVLESLGLIAERPVVVGHGANGLLVKALNMTSDPWRVSFEAPLLKDTPVAALANHTGDEKNRSRVVNFFGDGSIYALPDDTTLINYRIPDYRVTKWLPRNPFQTFCFTVAACSNDARFDSLCNDVLGKERFTDIWKSLGRLRID